MYKPIVRFMRQQDVREIVSSLESTTSSRSKHHYNKYISGRSSRDGSSFGGLVVEMADGLAAVATYCQVEAEFRVDCFLVNPDMCSVPEAVALVVDKLRHMEAEYITVSEFGLDDAVKEALIECDFTEEVSKAGGTTYKWRGKGVNRITEYLPRKWCLPIGDDLAVNYNCN